jgi:ATP-dependent Clp protease, protease subunit
MINMPSAEDVISMRAAEAAEPAHGDQLRQWLLRQRILFLGQEVNDEIANRLCSELLLLSSQDAKRDIFLYINSPGGSVTAGMAIYDIMQYVENDVATVAVGFAASMGQFLLCSGAPGKRYALPNARVVMHQPLGGIGGTASDVKIMAEQMVAIKATLAQKIAMHTGQPVERIVRDSDRDRWFTAEEAKEYGFVDHVVDSARQVRREAAVA